MNVTRALRLAATSVALLCVALWLGGIVVLGAIVAPAVFHIVPAPASADAMTVVFVRFDKIAMMAAAMTAVAEVIRARTRGPEPTRVDLARLAVLTLAGALAVVQGLWLSPGIVRLHEAGAVRGSGRLGLELDRLHDWSERLGKTEALLLVLFVVLLVGAPSSDEQQSR